MNSAAITVIGDGQLARMMHTAAIELGVELTVLAGAEDSSAAQVVAHTVLGDYRDLADLRRASHHATAVTFDHEHVPNEHAETLLSEGVVLEPRPHALIYAQDKLEQRRKLSALGFPVPQFMQVTSPADLAAFWADTAGAVCLKAARGGYDGHGVWFPETLEEATELAEQVLATDIPLLAEAKVPFTRELSILVARNRAGEVRTWAVTESVQEGGVCVEAVAPAPQLAAEASTTLRQMGEDIATALDVTGVLAVETFQLEDGSVLINELAIRPHNTGHWTQDGSVTSQFEQHLRAVLNLPLGETATTAGYTVMANALGALTPPEAPLAHRMAEIWRRYPQAKIHVYGKEYRPGRKLGHVNVTGDDLAATRAAANAAAAFLVSGQWPEEAHS